MTLRPSSPIALVAPILLAAFLQGSPAPTRLRAPNATLDAEFTRVAAVRELAEGRALVTDAAERKLFVVDFSAGTAVQLGREGQGPEEYRSVGALFAIGADSTLLVDLMGGRWLLLHGGKIAATVGSDAPAIRNGARSPTGADSRGNVLATRAMGGGVGPGAAPLRTDSSHLVRIARATGQGDTVAALFARPSRIRVSGPPDRPTAVEITTNPLAAGDLAAMFDDGTIAVARVSPYRVDWIAPDGRTTRGAPLPFTHVGVSAREKDAVMRRQAEQSGRAPQAPESVPDWPDILPPFLAGALLPAPDGRLWIRRTPSAADPSVHYDVITRTGQLAARITMSAREQVVGFGRSAIYTVVTDEDALQRLRRHPSTLGPSP